MFQLKKIRNKTLYQIIFIFLFITIFPFLINNCSFYLNKVRDGAVSNFCKEEFVGVIVDYSVSHGFDHYKYSVLETNRNGTVTPSEPILEIGDTIYKWSGEACISVKNKFGDLIDVRVSPNHDGPCACSDTIK